MPYYCSKGLFYLETSRCWTQHTYIFVSVCFPVIFWSIRWIDCFSIIEPLWNLLVFTVCWKCLCLELQLSLDYVFCTFFVYIFDGLTWLGLWLVSDSSCSVSSDGVLLYDNILNMDLNLCSLAKLLYISNYSFFDIWPLSIVIMSGWVN